jgi:GMP synthase-like glutamine amidotransferase
MRIAVIEADRPAPFMVGRYPSYGEMCAAWLAPALPEARFAMVNIAAGAPCPDEGSYDGLLLTGSRAGVYEDHPWIAPYEAPLRRARAAGRPVGGICFGHQIMAQAYGGRVEKSPQGWTIGRRSHRVSDAGRPLFAGREALSSLSFHQDQVVELPPGARVVLADERSPHSGLAYDFPALSVQFHPEFKPGFVDELLAACEPDPVPPALAAEVRAGLFGPLDSAEIAAAFARLYRQAAGL